MFPYQIYQALADERARAGIAAAHRRELVAEAVAGAASNESTAATVTSRLRELPSRIAALVTGRRGARGPAKTATSTAGPMGCVA